MIGAGEGRAVSGTCVGCSIKINNYKSSGQTILSKQLQETLRVTDNYIPVEAAPVSSKTNVGRAADQPFVTLTSNIYHQHGLPGFLNEIPAHYSLSSEEDQQYSYLHNRLLIRRAGR